MIEDQSYGIIPISHRHGDRQFLLVRHKAGHWSFPKGHPHEGETPAETARRELAEETGLSLVELTDAPGFDEVYEFTKHKSGKRVRKTVTYFIGYVDGRDVCVQEKEITDAAWGDAQATRERMTFPEGRELLDRVMSYLEARPRA